MGIAVIIPVLNEQKALTALLPVLIPLGFEEIIVVDGGSRDGTVDVARKILKSASDSPYRIISGPCGRASQMNAGAALAHSDILVFLHADTQLPHNARQVVADVMDDLQCVGGRFDVRFPRDTGYAWMVSRLMNLRSRWSGISTGDQTMFVRRSVFEELGGFANIPLMEDIEFSRRLKRVGTIASLRAKVITSFRRWEQHGPLRTIVRMWTLRAWYWLGWDPRRLQQYYETVR
ncbi:MAG: TIGR04283 family arsenosugar biosynthesis glycosyltransferase [Nitrospirales bacterium]|nr:TIGR04283 family arsenosugar biosynthesis glycosyltransferase [Nitrospirales bacterium]MDR4484091.1 TIGR04283 family arsenosugar biosynthesis glycosyltransferase [Nitrospirales bacterium]